MKGFSIIEIIVVIAIISIVGSVSVVTYNTMRKVGDTKHAAYVFVDALKEAKNKAKMMDNNTDWGVKINLTDITVFSGSSYNTRNSNQDKTYEIPPNLTISGPTEIVFSKFSSLPNTFGTTTFGNAFGTSSTYVLEAGVIGY